MRNFLLIASLSISTWGYGQVANLALTSTSIADQTKCVSLKDIKQALDDEAQQLLLSYDHKENIELTIEEKTVPIIDKEGKVYWDIADVLKDKENGDVVIAEITWGSKSENKWTVNVSVDKNCKCDVSEQLSCSTGIKMIELDVCHDDCNDWTYRCGKGCSSNKMTVKQNELSGMRLVNLNPLRYEYSVNGSELILHQEGAEKFESAYNNISSDDKKDGDGLLVDSLGNKLESAVYNFMEKASSEAEKEGLINEAVAASKSLKVDIDADMAIVKSRSCLHEDELVNLREDLMYRFKQLPDISLLNTALKGVPEGAKDPLEKALESYVSDVAHIRSELVKLFGVQFETTTLPYQVKGRNIDAITYEVSGKDLISNKTVTSSYNVFVRGGVKLDFSAGLFVTGLRDRSYATNDTTVVKIDGADTSSVVMRRFIDREKLPMDFSVATMFNATTRWGETANVGLSVGLGASIQGNFQMMFGGTLVFGKFQRLALHGGVALGWYSDLEAGYKAWDLDDSSTYGNMYDLGDSNTPPMTKRFGYSWFAGISYNLTKAKTEKAEEE